MNLLNVFLLVDRCIEVCYTIAKSIKKRNRDMKSKQLAKDTRANYKTSQKMNKAGLSSRQIRRLKAKGKEVVWYIK